MTLHFSKELFPKLLGLSLFSGTIFLNNNACSFNSSLSNRTVKAAHRVMESGGEGDALSSEESSTTSASQQPSFFSFNKPSFPSFIDSTHKTDLVNRLSEACPRPLKALASDITEKLVETAQKGCYFKGVVSFADEYFFQELHKQFSETRPTGAKPLECFYLDCDQWRSSFNSGNQDEQKAQAKLLENFFTRVENNPNAVVVFKNLRCEDASFLRQENGSVSTVVHGENLGDICHDTLRVVTEMANRKLEAMLPALQKEVSKVITEVVQKMGKIYLPGFLLKPVRNHVYSQTRKALDLGHASKRAGSSVSPIPHNSEAQKMLMKMAKRPVNVLFCSGGEVRSEEITEHYTANISLRKMEDMAKDEAKAEGLTEAQGKQLLALCYYCFGSDLKLDVYLKTLQTARDMLRAKKITEEAVVSVLWQAIQSCYPSKKEMPSKVPSSLFFPSTSESFKSQGHEELLKKIEHRLGEQKADIIGIEDPSFDRLQSFASAAVQHFEKLDQHRVAYLNLDIGFLNRCKVSKDDQILQFRSLLREEFAATPSGKKLLCVLPPCLKGLHTKVQSLFQELKEEYPNVEANGVQFVTSEVDYSQDTSFLCALSQKVQTVALQVLQRFGLFPKTQDTSDSFSHVSENFSTGALHLSAPSKQEIEQHLGADSFKNFKKELLSLYEYLLSRKGYNFERISQLHQRIQDANCPDKDTLLDALNKEHLSRESDVRYYLNMGSFYTKFSKRVGTLCAQRAAISFLPSLSFRVVALAGGIFALGGALYTLYRWMKKK